MMRRLYITLLLSVAVYFSHGQEILSKITRNYFRSDPFNTEFSSFMSHLLNDPTLSDKIVEKRTDSSLFFFEGTYKTFNPFFFKPKRVEVVLSEMVIDQDSLPKDTIYTYELFAYDDNSPEGEQEVKKEFDKIFRHYQGKFYRNQLTENPADDKVKGATYNFFDSWHAVSPFALSWFGPTAKNEMCLILTVRMDTYLNRAVLPMPFDASQ